MSIQLGPFTVSLENGKLVIDADTTEKQRQTEKLREVRLVTSVRKFLTENGGFRKDSEISRKYGYERSEEVKRVLPSLDIKAFVVQSGGRPATYYVLQDSIDNFHRYALERGRSIVGTVELDRLTSFT